MQNRLATEARARPTSLIGADLLRNRQYSSLGGVSIHQNPDAMNKIRKLKEDTDEQKTAFAKAAQKKLKNDIRLNSLIKLVLKLTE